MHGASPVLKLMNDSSPIRARRPVAGLDMHMQGPSVESPYREFRVRPHNKISSPVFGRAHHLVFTGSIHPAVSS
jgi:hypothetical protein